MRPVVVYMDTRRGKWAFTTRAYAPLPPPPPLAGRAVLHGNTPASAYTTTHVEPPRVALPPKYQEFCFLQSYNGVETSESHWH